MNPITKLQLCFAALSREVNNLDLGDLYLRPTTGDVTTSTVIDAILGLSNPSAVSFLHVNASNVPTWMTAANYRTALGLGTGDSPELTALSISSGVLKGTAGGTVIFGATGGGFNMAAVAPSGNLTGDFVIRAGAAYSWSATTSPSSNNADLFLWPTRTRTTATTNGPF